MHDFGPRDPVLNPPPSPEMIVSRGVTAATGEQK